MPAGQGDEFESRLAWYNFGIGCLLDLTVESLDGIK